MFDKVLLDTIIAVEDARFYRHFGIDIIGVFRALWANIRARKYVQGGSTITQQLARTIYHLSNEKTISRKLKEVWLALHLERVLTKERILHMYVRNVYMGQDREGNPIKGFEAASLNYFGIPLENLNILGKAMLVAMLKGPNKYKIRSQAGRDRTLKILMKMSTSNIANGRDWWKATNDWRNLR